MRQTVGWAVAWAAGVALLLGASTAQAQKADKAGKPAAERAAAGKATDSKSAESRASESRATEKKAAESRSETAKPRRAGGRLPAHYADIVSGEQREKIYAIQREYTPQLAPLRAQIAKIEQEMMVKIEAVLTPDQLKKAREMKAAAEAKRKAKTP